MFNLESSIITWREEMLAAGIQSPVPLEEIETHLREEITLQSQAGVDEQRAFESAMAQMGRADLIKTEFKKSEGFFRRFSITPLRRTSRILALLWIVNCTWGLFISNHLAHVLHGGVSMIFLWVPVSEIDFIRFLLLISIVVDLCGIVAGIRLFWVRMVPEQYFILPVGA